MQCLIKGFFGAVGGCLLLGFLILAFRPHDYEMAEPRYEVGVYLAQLVDIKSMIAARAIQQKSLNGVGKNLPLPELNPLPDFFEISDSGRILLSGGKERVFLVLTPRLENGEIKWNCTGNPRKALPMGCRG